MQGLAWSKAVPRPMQELHARSWLLLSAQGCGWSHSRGQGAHRGVGGRGRVMLSPLLVPIRNIGSKLTVSADTSSCSGRTSSIRSLEHVQVQLSLSYSRRGDLRVTLRSPMGTTSTLVTVRYGLC